MSKLKVDILTNDEIIAEICRKYWNWSQVLEDFEGTVSSIASEYGLKSSYQVNQVVSSNSRAYATEIVCSICGKPYTFSSRSDFKQSHFHTNWICEECREDIQRQEAAKHAKRQEIEQLEQENRHKRQREIIQHQHSLQNRVSINVREIGLKDAVYLLSMIRAAISEDFELLYPIGIIESKLAPTDTLQYDIVRYLYKNRLILIHPNSHPKAFDFNGNTIESFYLDRVLWTIPYSTHEDSTISLIKDLENIFHKMDWPEKWHSEQIEIWKDIGLHESLEFLHICLAEHELPFKPGEKTRFVISQVLENFSVAQAYNFIWRAAKDAAAFYVRNKTTKQHAANTVVGAIQHASERALAQGWDVKAYGRSYSCPQSILSQVYFNAVLQIGDDGFNRKPFEI